MGKGDSFHRSSAWIAKAMDEAIGVLPSWGSQHRHKVLSVWVSLALGARPMDGVPTHRVAGVGPFHFREASHFRVEYIHLLHQGGEGCLRGLTHLLIDTFGLK